MNRLLLDAGWAEVCRRWPGARPRCGLILGSGWGPVADLFSVRDSLDYASVPGLGAVSVAGHAGRLLWGDLAGLETFVFWGRRHFYEGQGWEPVALPIFILRRAGASVVAITNAAGGLAPDLEPGAFMAVSDHINMMDAHPLIGPHDPDWGPRFPDLTQVYDPVLRRAFLAAAARHGCSAREGVYLAVSGPVFETPAEVRAFRFLGADAVGMSTAPEAVLAHASGLRVLGISCIVNRAAGLGPGPLSHDDVQRVMAVAAGRICPVLADVWPELVGS